MPEDDTEPLLTTGEAARLLGVGTKTVTRWANAGLLGSIRTLGGHRRFRESDIRDLQTQLAGDPNRPIPPPDD